jgi:hypothetical protein
MNIPVNSLLAFHCFCCVDAAQLAPGRCLTATNGARRAWDKRVKTVA